MNAYNLTPAARNDLTEIAEFLLENSGPDRAEAIIRAIFQTIAKAGELPHMGHRRQDLTEEDVLFWTANRYYVIYRPDTNPLEVVAVLSTYRDIGPELSERA